MKITLIHRGNVLFAPGYPGFIREIGPTINQAKVNEMLEEIVCSGREEVPFDIKAIGQEGDGIVSAVAAKVPEGLTSLLQKIAPEGISLADFLKSILPTQPQVTDAFKAVLACYDLEKMREGAIGVNKLDQDQLDQRGRHLVLAMENAVRAQPNDDLIDLAGVLNIPMFSTLGACVFGHYDSLDMLEANINDDRLEHLMKEGTGYWKLLRAGAHYIHARNQDLN